MQDASTVADEVRAQSSDAERSFIGAVLPVLRDAIRGALAAWIAGVVVLGIGGRLVMRLAAVIHPTATGRFTENGNAIGAITVEGTLFVLLFGGLIFGLMSGIVWVAVSTWIPGRGVRRAVLAAPIAAALGSFLLVESGNPDFGVLGNDPLVIALLVTLIATFGFGVALLDERLDRALPAATNTPRPIALGYIVSIVVGAILFLPLAVGFYLSTSVCGCGQAPVAMGVSLLVTGGATVAWWIVRWLGSQRPPAPLVIVGRLSLAAAVVFGILRLSEEASRILISA